MALNIDGAQEIRTERQAEQAAVGARSQFLQVREGSSLVIRYGGAEVGARPAINLVAGANINLLVVDDDVENEVEITIEATIPSSALSVVTKTASYAVTTADDVVIGDSASAITFDLPPGASRGIGEPYYFKNINTGVVTLNPDGAELIDGAATLDLAERDSFEVVWTGTAWETF